MEQKENIKTKLINFKPKIKIVFIVALLTYLLQVDLDRLYEFFKNLLNLK